MKIDRLFRRLRFGVFALFAIVVLSIFLLSIRTVSSELETEYVSNSSNIATNIADASVDILLNRNLATLQSLIDQFVQIESIRYIYIANEGGEFLAHTFVPGIPGEILASDPSLTEPVERSLPGLGEFVEVGAPILSGRAGWVHVGMDTEALALKIQRAVGQQIYLLCIILVVGVLALIWIVKLTAKPLEELLTYVVALARNGGEAADSGVLARKDEIGDMARLMASRRRSGSLAQAAGPGQGPEVGGEIVRVPRAVVVLFCTVLQLCLGTVYAWSFFQTMLVRDSGWSFSETAAAFSITIFCLGVSAAIAGQALPRVGPRALALAGSLLFSSGYVVASLALSLESMWLFYLGYGVIGGAGIGMGYVTPVATAAKWYPDRKGLVTGIVVMGFGVGALLLSKGLAPLLVVGTQGDLAQVFLWLGVVFGCILIPSSLFI